MDIHKEPMYEGNVYITLDKEKHEEVYRALEIL